MAGVEVILRLSSRMAEMQHKIVGLEAELRRYGKADPVKRKSNQEVKDG